MWIWDAGKPDVFSQRSLYEREKKGCQEEADCFGCRGILRPTCAVQPTLVMPTAHPPVLYALLTLLAIAGLCVIHARLKMWRWKRIKNYKICLVQEILINLRGKHETGENQRLHSLWKHCSCTVERAQTEASKLRSVIRASHSSPCSMHMTQSQTWCSACHEISKWSQGSQCVCGQLLFWPCCCSSPSQVVAGGFSCCLLSCSGQMDHLPYSSRHRTDPPPAWPVSCETQSGQCV